MVAHAARYAARAGGAGVARPVDAAACQRGEPGEVGEHEVLAAHLRCPASASEVAVSTGSSLAGLVDVDAGADDDAGRPAAGDQLAEDAADLAVAVVGERARRWAT